MKFRFLPVVLVICITTILIAPPAHATIMRYMEIEDLTRLSSDVFHGQVISATTYWNLERTRIYTDVRIRISETFKGSVRQGRIVTITQLGGEKDGIKLDYSGRPEFTPGESVILFTTPGKNSNLTVVGLKQGKMNLVGDEIRRDFSGLMVVDAPKGSKSLRQFVPKPTRLTLDELRTRIARTK